MVKEYLKVQKVLAEQFDSTQNTMFGHSVVKCDNDIYFIMASGVELPYYSELGKAVYFGVGDWLVKRNYTLEVVHPEYFNEDYYPTK